MKTRHFLTLGQWDAEELKSLVERAVGMKAEFKSGAPHRPLVGKTLGLLFFKASTRTRISFEAAMSQLGGSGLFLSSGDLQLRRGESIADTARVLSRYLDGLVIRTASHGEVEAWAADSSIPIINGLTDLHHPCQILGDLVTIKERFGVLRGLTLAYIGDGNNVVHSLIEGCALTGMNFRIASPEGFDPDASVVKGAADAAGKSGARIEMLRDPREAARNADILYTDVWVSMGQEAETQRREKVFAAYRIDRPLLDSAKPTAVVMHCLPAYRGKEITADVLDGPRSVVWDQAENRLHAQKALLERLLV